MLRLDQAIASMGQGKALIVVIGVAALLGLRHATDPDHLTAVSTLIASDTRSATSKAARLGLVWGLGHGTTLFLFGAPIVLFRQYLPDPLQTAAEVLVGVVIMALALRLILRWRRAHFHAHPHRHGDRVHRHLHPHDPAGHAGGSPHSHSHPALLGRSLPQAYVIGLVHGVGGSAAVGVLLLASLKSPAVGLIALAIFACFTAISMCMASTAFGFVLAREAVRRRFMRVMGPAFGGLSFAFGAWYALGALHAVAYVF